MNTAQQATPNSDGYLSAEVLLTGGLSVLVGLAMWAFVDASAPVYTVGALAYYLGFVVNNPHFLSSYTLLYGDYRERIFQQKEYLWAAVIVPLVLGAAIVTALYAQNVRVMGQLVSLMFVLVGWHYVKQIFGCVIVSSVRRKIFYTHNERRILLFNLFCIWALSWVNANIEPRDFEFYGIHYYSLELPVFARYLNYALVGLSLTAVVAIHVRKYLEQGIQPAPPAVAAFAAIYLWYIPTLHHPGFNYLIPFFHSLQYLVFVWVLKRNEVGHRAAAFEGREARATWMRSFLGYGLFVLVLAAFSLEFIPGLLDRSNIFAAGVMGSAPFFVGFSLFINIHHYFIDNVIWRSDNPTVKNYLMGAPAVSKNGQPIQIAG